MMVATQSAATDLGTQRGTPRTPLGSKRYHRTPQWPRNPPIGRNFRPRSHIRNLRNSRKVSIVYESSSLSCTTPLSARAAVCASSRVAVTPEHPSHTRLTPPPPPGQPPDWRSALALRTPGRKPSQLPFWDVRPGNRLVGDCISIKNNSLTHLGPRSLAVGGGRRRSN